MVIYKTLIPRDKIIKEIMQLEESLEIIQMHRWTEKDLKEMTTDTLVRRKRALHDWNSGQQID